MDCSGIEGACDPTTNHCNCPSSSKKIDPNTCAGISSPGGLGTGTIVAIAICVPLAIVVLLGVGLFALYWFKYRSAYDTI
jgi:hypothetical protein